MPFEIVSHLVDDVRTVSEESLSRALLLCLERAKMVVEPAGVAAVAGILDDPAAFEPPVVAVLSGGNVDPLLLLRVIRHGLAAAGRYVSLQVRVADSPGPPRGPAGAPGRAGRERRRGRAPADRSGLHVDEVAINVQLETRGAEHCVQVIDALRALGYS